MKKTLKRTLTCIIALIMSCSIFVGCSKRDDKPQTLEYYCWTAGYGISWVEKMMEDFSKQDWVKEKYPELKIVPVYNDNQSFTDNRITLGKGNTIDLFFGMNTPGLHGSEYILDLTEPVFNQKVPGEEILYKDKVSDLVLGSITDKDKQGNDKYYGVPWSISFGGLLYNATLFSKLGLTVPKTTDEMFAMMDKVKSLNGENANYKDKTYSIISAKITYAEYLYPVWWTQYEGFEGYDNFYNAIDEDGVKNSSEIFKQTGRLKALEVFHDIYNENNGYYDRSSINYEFKQGQIRLLRGDGLMMINGDWFSSEMRTQANEYYNNGYQYDIRVMRTPVISAIIEKTPSIKALATALGKTNDEVLSMVIDEVDQGKTESSITFGEGDDKLTVSSKDFETIRNARGILYANLTGTKTYIPAYATAKDVAVDFVRYMATDRANAIYAQETLGARTSFDFNYEDYDSEGYQTLLDNRAYKVQQDFQDALNYPACKPLPEPATYVLSAKGGIRVLGEYSDLEKKFMSDKNLTAKAVFDSIIDYYEVDNGRRWQQVLKSAELV